MIGMTVTFCGEYGDPVEGIIIDTYNGMLCIETLDGDICEIPEDQVIYY